MKSLFILPVLFLVAGVYCDNLWTVDDRALAEAEEEAAKRTIITYDKANLSEKEIEDLMKEHEERCGCTVKHLKYAGAFILIYSSANHIKVEDLNLDPTKEVGGEDAVAHLNGLLSRVDNPTDPQFSDQWELQDLSNNADMNIREGWETYLADDNGKDPNGPSVIVAVIDTGVDYNHPDLKDQMWTNPGEIAGNGIDDDGNGIVDDVYGADFTGSSPIGDPIDRHSHGTHCAGTIAAKENNGKGIAGVSSFTQGKVKIMALKGLSDSGTSTAGSLFECLDYAISKGARISSNSWGGGGISSYTEQMWDSVLQNNPDHLFIAAAGNSNEEISDTNKMMSCGLKEANQLCVASSTWLDERSSFSNYGRDYVHVVAPGSSILSTIPGEQYARKSGTSMACPQVSGFAALIRTMRPDLNGQEVRAVIESNVQLKSAYTTIVSSGGLIDIGKTLKALKEGSSGSCQKTTVIVKTTTTRYGNENSWTIGSCTNEAQFENDKTVSQTCCLATGSYNLECKDTYGDGWHGGYLEINGKTFCEKFTSGSSKTEVVTI